MSLINSVRNYMLTCDVLDMTAAIKVDALGESPIEYSISPLPSESIIRKYVDGSSQRKYDFAFFARSQTDILMQYIENQNVFENLQEWLEQQTELENFPILESGKTAEKIQAITSGFLSEQSDSTDTAVYQITCQLIYRQSEV